MQLDRYRRQKAFHRIGNEGQQRLASARVCLVGVGALGSVIAERLVRAGIGYLRLLDRDWVELDNLPRQTLYTEHDALERLPKSTAARKALLKINSAVDIEANVVDFVPNNAMDLTERCDLIIDGTDNFETRYLINDVSLERSIPWVHGGVVGASGQVMGIVPGKTCCLRCILPDVPDHEAMETCNSAGVIGPAVSVIASLQAMLAMKLIVDGPNCIASEWLSVDCWDLSFRKFKADPAALSNACPACQGERDFLNGKLVRLAEVLCGRNAVQLQGSQKQIDLGELASKLHQEKVDSNPFFVRLTLPTHELTVFRDGRTIVSGTEDPAEARRLVAQWIGG